MCCVLTTLYERLMSVIGGSPRRYIFFCGAVFESLLRPYVVQQHSFHLRKSDAGCTHERQKSRFANLSLRHDDQQISGGLAHSSPRQGIPMSAYAEECRDRYSI